jgi:hypothetical protein
VRLRLTNAAYREGRGRRAIEDGLADQHVIPREWHAVLIEPDLEAVQELRAIVLATHVVLASPHGLDRYLRGLGDGDRLGHDVGEWIAAMTEPAAQEGRVDRDLLRRNMADRTRLRPVSWRCRALRRRRRQHRRIVGNRLLGDATKGLQFRSRRSHGKN